MRLRNKINEIKKFHHVLKGHVQLFYFIFSFQFSKEILQNGRNVTKSPSKLPKCVKNVKKNLFCPLTKKSHKIKLFCHILIGHMELFNFFFSVRKSSKLTKTGPKWLKSPKKGQKGGPNWHTVAVWSWADGVCGPKAHTP